MQLYSFIINLSSHALHGLAANYYYYCRLICETKPSHQIQESYNL